MNRLWRWLLYLLAVVWACVVFFGQVQPIEVYLGR